MTANVESPIKEPTINFAIGPSCPVRCEGCYNHFADTSTRGGLINAQQIIDFASSAVNEGVTQTTVSGGDPLFHPEIIPILSGLKDIGMKVKLDTVGTAFLDDTRVVFKGKGIVPKVEIDTVAPHVDFVNIPLDGASQETVANFRRGRNELFAETLQIAELLRNAGIRFGFNTVANTSNINELESIKDIAQMAGASEWQIFEYDPEGPNPSNRKDMLRLEPGVFDAATKDLESDTDAFRIVHKNLIQRGGIYFLVDDSGMVWKPIGEGFRQILGHITLDREQVLMALRRHISERR